MEQDELEKIVSKLMDQCYPVSEIFTSCQGEGEFSGTLMTFIRLAGCSVGKPYPKEMHEPKIEVVYHERDSSSDYERKIPGLPIYTEKCTLYDGREFPCDTDYGVKERLSVEDIRSRIPKNVEHVCITGGEPFIHNLEPLVNGLLGYLALEKIHIETSGTIPLSKAFPTAYNVHALMKDLWITVSPKKGALVGMVQRANEIKILIDERFDPAFLPDYILLHPKIYIQPVNGEHTVNAANLKRCLELQLHFTNWRISPQLHKTIEHFVKERVR